MMKQEREANTSESGFQGLLTWFAKNHVAANLLMLAVIVIGLIVSLNIRQA